MIDDDDLRVLAAGRPAPLPLDAAATARARDALLADATGERSRRRPRPASSQRLRPRGRRRVLGFTAAVAVAAAVATLATDVVGNGSASRRGSLAGAVRLGVDDADAAPLVRLSHRVQASTGPVTGDATLILRTQPLGDGSTATGADLYLDSGVYYYARTRAQLRGVVANDQRQDGGFAVRAEAAAVAALTEPADVARQAMADAALDPKDRAAAQAIARKRRQAETKAGTRAIDPQALDEGKKPGPKGSIDPRATDDNHIWGSSFDALIAGAGRPDVRAGVLKVIATIPSVTVTPATTGGRDELALSAAVFGDAYRETLWIDAKTGVPLRFAAGYPGKAPSGTITYTVSRVTAADIARGS
jgi:hypothetical protein